jgi:phosphatidylglycerophosphate synthase
VIRRAAYPLWMIAAVAFAVARHDPAWCAAAGGGALGIRFARARGWRTAASGRLALANLVTTMRLGVVVAMPSLGSTMSRVALAGVVVALLLVDGLDGYLARSRGEASEFGAAYDMETDALAIMLLSLLLYHKGLAGGWVLAAGLWRYAYAAAVAMWPALGDCPPSPIYRWIFTALMVSLAVAFLPLGSAAGAAAAVGTGLVSFSFLHSIFRSRAVTGAARPSGSRASSDHRM